MFLSSLKPSWFLLPSTERVSNSSSECFLTDIKNETSVRQQCQYCLLPFRVLSMHSTVCCTLLLTPRSLPGEHVMQMRKLELREFECHGQGHAASNCWCRITYPVWFQAPFLLATSSCSFWHASCIFLQDNKFFLLWKKGETILLLSTFLEFSILLIDS
jgi:hypothetical protein